MVLQRCIPALDKWLDTHPTNRPEDPLWISEKSIKARSDGSIEVQRYAYPALPNAGERNSTKIGITKPTDFYKIRHSSWVLDKKDNLPVDFAAERHGHSVKHFVGTYGRTSVEDVIQRFKAHYGTEANDPTKTIEHQNCQVCQTLNQEGSSWCAKCGTPFNTTAAIEMASQYSLSKLAPKPAGIE